jgi:acyl-CoA thioester hydrolase
VLVVTCRFELRFGDLDFWGHLNQSAYHELLGESRVRFFRAANDGELMDYILRRVELDHLAEISDRDRFAEVRTTVSAIGDKSVTLGHEVIRPDGTTAAQGVSIMVAFDREARAARSVTPDERRRFETAAPAG